MSKEFVFEERSPWYRLEKGPFNRINRSRGDIEIHVPFNAGPDGHCTTAELYALLERIQQPLLLQSQIDFGVEALEVGKLQFSCSGLERLEDGIEGHLVRVHSAFNFLHRHGVELDTTPVLIACRKMAVEILRVTGLYWLELEFMGRVYKVKRRTTPSPDDYVWIPAAQNAEAGA